MRKILFSALIFSFFATNAVAGCIADFLFDKRDFYMFCGYATADIDVNGSIVDITEECNGIKPGNNGACIAGGEASFDIG